MEARTHTDPPTHIYIRLLLSSYYHVDQFAKVVIYKVVYLHVAQGPMNGAHKETQTHSCRFASLV